MRRLLHPKIEDVTVEGVLRALADPVRAPIYVEPAGSACAQNCSNFLEVKEQAIPKSTLSVHFKALREAGLTRAKRVGVEMQSTSRCAEIEGRFPGLLAAIVNAHKVQRAENARAAKELAKIEQTEQKRADELRKERARKRHARKGPVPTPRGHRPPAWLRRFDFAPRSVEPVWAYLPLLGSSSGLT